MKKLLWMKKFIQTAVEHKFDNSKGNLSSEKWLHFSIFLQSNNQEVYKTKKESYPHPQPQPPHK